MFYSSSSHFLYKPEITKMNYFRIPEYKDESRNFITKAYIVDIHSPDLIKMLYKQAECCNVSVSEHLDFLINHGGKVQTDAENIILFDRYQQLEFHISHDRDYGVEARNCTCREKEKAEEYHIQSRR